LALASSAARAPGSGRDYQVDVRFHEILGYRPQRVSRLR